MVAEGGRQRHLLSDRQERRMRASALLAEQAHRLSEDPLVWRRWLSLAARLKGLSGRNVLLALAQDPEATDLAGVEQWRRRGRIVQGGVLPVVLVAGSGAAELFDVRHTAPATEDEPDVVGGPDRLLDSRRAGTSGPDRALTVGPLADLLAAMSRAAAAERRTDTAAEERAWLAARDLARDLVGQNPSGAGRGESIDSASADGHGVDVTDAAATLVLIALGRPEPSDMSWDPGVAGQVIASPVVGMSVTRVINVLDAIAATAATIRARCEAAVRAGFGQSRAAVPTGTAVVHEDPDRRIRRLLVESAEWFSRNGAASWVPGYLAGRGHGWVPEGALTIGYAPPGGARLVAAMRRKGFDGDEVHAAGLAVTTSNGRLVDRLRDRLVVVIHDAVGPVGFVGRARPGSNAPVPRWIDAGPAGLLHIDRHVIGLTESAARLLAGARPVLVADALDAVAVDAAGGGRVVGLAPAGGTWGSDHIASVAMATTLAPLLLVPGDDAGLAIAVALSDADHPQLLGAHLALTPDGGAVAHVPVAALAVLLSESRLWWPLAAAQALRVLRETDPAAETAHRVAACRIAAGAVARIPDPGERLRLSTVITHQLDLPPSTVRTLVREAASGASVGGGTAPGPMTRVVAGERLTLVDDPDGRCWSTSDGWLLQPGAPTPDGVITYAVVRPAGEGAAARGDALERYIASAAGLAEAVATVRRLRTTWLLGGELAGEPAPSDEQVVSPSAVTA